MPSRGVEALGDRKLAELDLVLGCDPDGLGDAPLLDEPANDGAALPVEARFDSRMVPDGDEARLDRGQGPVHVLADEDAAVVDVHALHSLVSAHASFGNEVGHDSDDAREVGAHPPVADVDDRGPVALEG